MTKLIAEFWMVMYFTSPGADGMPPRIKGPFATEVACFNRAAQFSTRTSTSILRMVRCFPDEEFMRRIESTYVVDLSREWSTSGHKLPRRNERE